ncbi:hypothetical protein BDQ17DRAFT_672368 [Cyathus striatus]|nr:hypothetical protein BDQ17DRAFT_672368 [Cyathus striatus]
MSGSRYSTISIRLSDDLVDDRGAAIIDEDDFIPPSEDNFDIAPFLEVPPTPPPKSPNRIFGFGLTPKASFSSPPLYARTAPLASTHNTPARKAHSAHTPPNVARRTTIRPRDTSIALPQHTRVG